MRISQVIVGRSVRKITLVRAFVGKILYFPDETTSKDLIILFDQLVWLQEKCEKDPGFRAKFGLYLKVLAYILKNMNLSQGQITSNQINNLSNKFKRNLVGFAYEKRNIKPQIRALMSKIEVRPPKSLGVPKKQLPPEQYIGIGYRDKGTAKNPAFDGSPSWQEVASNNFKELEK